MATFVALTQLPLSYSVATKTTHCCKGLCKVTIMKFNIPFVDLDGAFTRCTENILTRAGFFASYFSRTQVQQLHSIRSGSSSSLQAYVSPVGLLSTHAYTIRFRIYLPYVCCICEIGLLCTENLGVHRERIWRVSSSQKRVFWGGERGYHPSPARSRTSCYTGPPPSSTVA